MFIHHFFSGGLEIGRRLIFAAAPKRTAQEGANCENPFNSGWLNGKTEK